MPNSSIDSTERPVTIHSEPPKEGYPIIRGVYIPDFEKQEDHRLMIGRALFNLKTSQLKNGVSISRFTGYPCVPSKLDIVVKDNRLYVSCIVWDLQKEETIAVMDYNRWALYKANMTDFNADDLRMEVRDKQSNIACQLDMTRKTSCFGLKDILLVNITFFITGAEGRPGMTIQECYSKTDSNWKTKAADLIKTIKSIF